MQDMFPSFMVNTTHLHIFTWVVGIVLFLVASQMKVGSKGRKVLHMIARLFYILILVSGFALFTRSFGIENSAVSAKYGIKFALGFLTIGFMEMVLVRAEKGKNPKVFWILFAVFLFTTMFLGLQMMGRI